jgi:polyribonucleotide nucleotidyltransferase
MFLVEKDFHGNKLSIETGRIAKQASGAAVVRYGESVVLVTACMGDERDGDFFPLTIDYVEKTYAAGKIPGGFLKREGKLSDKETLTSRLIDRPCRPLFPEGFKREVQVIATVLSSDTENDTDVLALCGASAALTVSDIPFEGPIAAVRVARIDGKLVINPTVSQITQADLNYIVAGSRDAIVMVEGGSKEVPEAEVLDALFFAHQELQVIIAMQDELRQKTGKQKIEFTAVEPDAELVKQVHSMAKEKLTAAVQVSDKLARKSAVSLVKEELKAALVKEDDEDAAEKTSAISAIFENLHYDVVRGLVFDKGVRVDGRDFTTVRPLDIEVGLLPRVHGSTLFQRGETQAIVAATLGTEDEAQRLDTLLDGESRKRFMLHYNFPPFSVGETKMLRGPGRREIGHGALAERAVTAVLPTALEFPYTIRVVSEITESNGSSSMASVCGATLALMDAGVPIKAPVAGVAMGLMKEGDRSVVLTDILGDEDHLGDMDFKVCGTEQGITALQMDIKIKGLDKDIMTKALAQAREGRLFILSKMKEILSVPRKEISPHAPRIHTFKINPEKIRDVIGQGGKTIRSIQESCNVKIDIQDNGMVSIAGSDAAKTQAAIEIVESLTAEAEIGKTYKGIVKRIADFGAFVEILPGTDGLLHISELAEEKVRRVSDIVQVGEEVTVKVLDVDRFGKIRLSRRAVLAEQQ